MKNKTQQLYDYLTDLNVLGSITASNKHLIEVTDFNDRTLYRALKELENKGLIKRETVSIGNSGKQRIITIL